VISRNEILGKLPPFKNYQVIVSHDQTVGEIIDGILMTHEKYKNEYDKISEYFIGDNEIETAQNIWNFLKSNVPYYIEDTKTQTLRSPSAIVAMPGDCKSYALFANGILNSLNKKGYFNIPLAYRFASYKDNKEIQHVFSVLYPGTNKEIWIDPVLKRFNEKREPTFYKDKKIKMALIAMSGVNDANKTEQLEAYRDRLVNERDRLLVNGQITPGSSKELQYKVAINTVTRQIQDAGISGFGDIGKTLSNFSVISGGAFAFGENKLRDQMKAFIDQYPLAFMYLYLPVGHDGNQNWGTEFGWNKSELPGIPEIVKQKRNKAFWTMWNWGQPTGLNAETDIVNLIREAVTKKLGTSPEQYWSKKLNLNIADKAAFGNMIGFEFTDAADAVVPGSGAVLKFAGPIIDSFVPDLTWEHQPDSFQPVAEDWQGSIYESKFPLNVSNKNGGLVVPGSQNMPGSTKAGMNIWVTLGLAGAAIFLISKMKK